MNLGSVRDGLNGPSPPEGWIAATLGRAGRLVGGSGFPHEAQGGTTGEIPFYKVSDLGMSGDSKLMGDGQHRISKAVALRLRATIVPSGTVLWAKIGAALLLNRRRMTREPACIDNNMTAFVPNPRMATTRWAFYWTSALDFGAFANPGAVPSFSEGSQARVPFWLPPLKDQHRIAAFLDHETTRIDELLHELERMASLGDERLETERSLLTLNGLGAASSFVDSGDRWLGRIPQTWRVTSLKRVSKVDNSGSFGGEAGALDIDVPVATTAQITPHGDFEVATMPIRSFGSDDVARYLCKPGEILVVKSSGSATNIISGKAGIVRDDTPPFIFSNFLLRLRPRTDLVDPEYLYLVVTSKLTRERIKWMCSTTTYPNLDVHLYTSAPIPLPPTWQQRELVSRAAQIDNNRRELRLAVQASQTLLSERRAALITAAVTGQIDVSTWTPPDDWLSPEAA